MAISIEVTKLKFSDLIGNVGAAWGLPENACRVHALLYINGAPSSKNEIGLSLNLSEEEVEASLAFLLYYELPGFRVMSSTAPTLILGRPC